MEVNEQTKRDYRQNLIDAGCSEALAQHCTELLRERKISETLRVLGAYRGSILDNMHLCQKQIDILDYFICEIKKEFL